MCYCISRLTLVEVHPFSCLDDIYRLDMEIECIRLNTNIAELMKRGQQYIQEGVHPTLKNRMLAVMETCAPVSSGLVQHRDAGTRSKRTSFAIM